MIMLIVGYNNKGFIHVTNQVRKVKKKTNSVEHSFTTQTCSGKKCSVPESDCVPVVNNS